MASLDSLPFDNRFARQPAGLYSRVQPRGLSRPRLVAFNPDVAALLDLDPACAQRPDFIEYFGGHRPLPGSNR